MKLDPISNNSVVNEILKRITDSIVREELKPGEKLPTEVDRITSYNVCYTKLLRYCSPNARPRLQQKRREFPMYLASGP